MSRLDAATAGDNDPSEVDADGNKKNRKGLEAKKIKTVKPGRNTVSRKIAAFWKGEIELVDKEQAKWIKRGRSVTQRYRDERNRMNEDQTRRMNLLWTNTRIMLPALLGKCPQAIVERKFLDQDPTGRLSSQLLERGLRTQVEEHGYYDCLRAALLDYLLPGRGVVWLRYEPEIGRGDSLRSGSNAFADLDEIEDQYNIAKEDEEEEKLEETSEEVITEAVMVDYINWEDFYIFPSSARNWDEVQAIGKKVYISRVEAIERFGEEIGEAIKPDTTPAGTDKSRGPFSDSIVLADINARDLVIFEIWNKTDRRAYWVSPGYDFLCDVKDDPLKLKRFFPIPKPLFSTSTNDTIVPVPDYLEWQDQAIQIDELTQRLAMLSKACKVAGTYDASQMGLKRLMDESLENQLIPVDSWAAHAEAGGLEGSISFLPIKEIQACIETLTTVRQQVKQDLDEVTGMSDVLRGTTDSRETLGGLRIKNNNAGTRLQDRQNEVARFARDTMAIMAEIMCKHFANDTLVECSGIKFLEELQPAEILAEFQSEMWEKLSTKMSQMQGFGGGGGPPNMGNPPPAPPPQGNSPPLMQGAAPNQQPPGPPQQPGNNVVPFQKPGMPQQQPQQPPPPPDPMQMMQMFMQQAMAKITPEQLIDKKIEDAIELLRNEINRNYRIDIETDSTIFGDAAQDREDATELVAALSQFLGQAEGLVAALPEGVPLMGKVLQWSFRKFRVGRDLESAVDEFIRKTEKKIKDMEKNPQAQSPEQQKAQAEIQKIQLTTQAKMQSDQAKAKLDLQVATQKGQMQAQNDQRDAQIKEMEAQRDMKLQEMEMQREMAVENMKLQIEQQKMHMEGQKAQMEMHQAHQQHQQTMQQGHMQHQTAMTQHQNTMQEGTLQHQHSMQEGAASHQQSMKQGEMKHTQAQDQQKMAKQKHSMSMEQQQAKHKQQMQAAKTPAGKPKATK